MLWTYEILSNEPEEGTDKRVVQVKYSNGDRNATITKTVSSTAIDRMIAQELDSRNVADDLAELHPE